MLCCKEIVDFKRKKPRPHTILFSEYKIKTETEN